MKIISMAKLHSPLFSATASGRVANLLTYSMRKSGSQVRIQKKQIDRITAPRLQQRLRFLTAGDSWHTLDYGANEYGSVLLGGRNVDIISLPQDKRAPQFARYVGDYLITFY